MTRIPAIALPVPSGSECALHPRVIAILAFLRCYELTHGRAPNYREICAAVGLLSRGGLFHHLNTLARHGLIERQTHTARTIRLLPKALANIIRD